MQLTFLGIRIERSSIASNEILERSPISRNRFFVLGDFNSKHSRWLYSRRNKAGEVLFQTSENSNFFIHHPDSYTRISAGGKHCSILDLVLSNNRVNMTVPKTFQELCSDHYPVVFNITLDSPFETHVCKYKNYNRAEWSCFTNSVKRRLDLSPELLNNLDSTEQIDDSIQDFVRIVKLKQNQSQLLISPRKNTKFPPKLSCLFD